jgi:hypothetical protein
MKIPKNMQEWKVIEKLVVLNNIVANYSMSDT